ncbi:MAG: hypothetical protein GXP25_04675 [Planctomycetes bacterium]|nr:hypothetical protein [Planctomycetota bacterium]
MPRLTTFLLIGVLLAMTGAADGGDKFNAINVSWGDHIVVFKGLGKLDTEEKIAEAMRQWKEQFGVRHVYWRISSKIIAKYMIRAKGTATKYYDALDEIESRVDCAAAAVRQAHTNGMKIFMYLTIYDMGSPPSVLYGGKAPFPWQSRFTAEHPEYLVVDREGKQRQYGVCEYGYSEVRRHKLDQIAELFDRYDFDGVYICTRTHSEPARHADQFGFNPPIVDEFKRRYGVDIRTHNFDKEKWRRLRGEYLVQFFRELRARFPKKLIAAAIPIGDRIGPPYGNMFLDWRAIVKDRLVDDLVVGVISGKWLYPNHRAKSDVEKGYLCSQEEKFNVPPIDQAVANQYGPTCLDAGVRLFIQGTACDRRATRRIENDKYLTGVMMHSTSIMSGKTCLEIADHPSFAFANAMLSIDFWIRLRSIQKGRAGRVISKYDHTLPNDTGRGWEIYINDQRRVVFRLGSKAGERALTSKTALPIGKWVHVACVAEGAGGRMRIHINGHADPSERDAPPSIRTVPVDVFIGRYAGGYTQFLDADLDEIRLSNVARTFNEPPSAPYAESGEGTVALYHCDRLDTSQIRNAAGDRTLDARAYGLTDNSIVSGPKGFGGAVKLETAR